MQAVVLMITQPLTQTVKDSSPPSLMDIYIAVVLTLTTLGNWVNREQ